MAARPRSRGEPGGAALVHGVPRRQPGACDRRKQVPARVPGLARAARAVRRGGRGDAHRVGGRRRRGPPRDPRGEPPDGRRDPRRDRRIQAEPAASAQRTGLLARLSAFTPASPAALPRVLRRSPQWLKSTAGTTLVTSVGMFGPGAGWAIGILPLHTLCLTVGSVTVKPGVVDGRVEPRTFLAVTASVDHDIVDGAPAARFVRRLREIVEGAEVLRPGPAGHGPLAAESTSGVNAGSRSPRAPATP